MANEESNPAGSKLARLLPHIAHQGAEKQNDIDKRKVNKSQPTGLPSAYAAEGMKSAATIATCSAVCLIVSLLLSCGAGATACLQSQSMGEIRYAGAPLSFWEGYYMDRFPFPAGGQWIVIIFFLDALFWLVAAISAWGACHWLIVRWYSRRWQFSLADMLALTAAVAFLFGYARWDFSLARNETTQRVFQTQTSPPNRAPQYTGPRLVPVSEVSLVSHCFLVLAAGSLGINLFHVAERYSMQFRRLK